MKTLLLPLSSFSFLFFPILLPGKRVSPALVQLPFPISSKSMSKVIYICLTSSMRLGLCNNCYWGNKYTYSFIHSFKWFRKVCDFAENTAQLSNISSKLHTFLKHFVKTGGEHCISKLVRPLVFINSICKRNLESNKEKSSY